MDTLSERGYVVAGIIWLVLLWLGVNEAPCLPSRCGPGSLMLAGIAGTGFLVPAYFIAIFLGHLAPSLVVKGKP